VLDRISDHASADDWDDFDLASGAVWTPPEPESPPLAVRWDDDDQAHADVITLDDWRGDGAA
jgi:hypothetical protein